jgi:hypothetical protein
MTELMVNFDDAAAQVDLFAHLRRLRGIHRITIVRPRNPHTRAQQGFYWSCVVGSFGKFLREQDMSHSDGDAHDLLKAKFLRLPVVSAAGELIGEKTRSTSDLNVEEYSEYIDACVAYLAEMFNVIVPDPTLYGVSSKPFGAQHQKAASASTRG